MSISKSAFYRLLSAGQIRTIQIGRSRRVPVNVLQDFVAGRISYPYAEAKVRYVYGQVYLSEGKANQVHDQLKESLAILNRLG